MSKKEDISSQDNAIRRNIQIIGNNLHILENEKLRMATALFSTMRNCISSKKVLSSLNKFLKNLKLMIIYLLGIYMYYLSLSSINSASMKCFRKRNLYCIMTIAKLVITSSGLMLFAFYVIFYRKIYLKFHLFIIIILYIYLFHKDQNAQIVKHGFYNFIGFIIITILLIIIASYIFLLRYLFRKSRFLMVSLFMAPFPFLFIFFNLYKRNHFFCGEWDKGLNHTFIDNDSKDYPCKINIPKNNTCLITEIGPFLDFTSLYRPTCNNTDYIKSQMRYFKRSLSRLANNISYYNISRRIFFGYPLTNNENFSYNICGTLVFAGLKSLETELHKNIILMDLFLKNKTLYYKDEPTPEVFVNFRAKKDKVIVKVNRNKTLVKERKKISRKLKSNRLFDNVLVIFFDTVSRAHFFRKFKKTVQFLEQFTKYEKDYNKKNMTIFQFLKFHSVNSFTNPNIKAAYFGSKFDGNGTHFANYFQENGYITGRTSTFCEKINVFSELPLTYVNWDHENIAIPCIKGIYNSFFTHKGASVVRRCLFGEDLIKYSFEYMESFWTTYLKENKLFVFDSGDGHEPTGQIVGYIDQFLYDSLKRFYSNGWLKDTTIFLFSDHGQHLGGTFNSLNSNDVRYELSLPFLFLFLPNKEYLYKDNLYEIIKRNQQIFITAFDIYDTLINIAFGKNEEMYKKFSVPLGNTLFSELNYTERYCDSPKIDSQINLAICNCKNV